MEDKKVGQKLESAIELLKKAHETLLNSTGAYNVIETLPIQSLVPGLNRCKQKCADTIKEIEEFLHYNNNMTTKSE